MNAMNYKRCKELFKDALIKEKNNWIHMKLEGLNVPDSIEFWKQYKQTFGDNDANFIGNLYKDVDRTVLVQGARKRRCFTAPFLLEIISKTVNSMRSTSTGSMGR